MHLANIYSIYGVSCLFISYCYAEARTEFAKKVSGGQSFVVCASMASHHVRSTLVRLFCKISKMGTHCGIYIFWWPWPKCLPWLHPWWWYVLYQALSTAFTM